MTKGYESTMKESGMLHVFESMEGKMFGGYKFEEVVGHGSFGKVYKASKNEKIFAIKSIELTNPGAAKTAKIEEFFANSIRFQHPFLVDYIDTFKSEKGDILFVVMPFCGGGDLEKIIGSLDYRYEAGLPEDKMMRIVIQLLLAVGTLHKNNMLHRDIKAGNVIFDTTGILKVADFGCSKQLEDTIGLASTYTGTRLYIAPEIYRGFQYNYPADVWSLGVLFYYLCVGRLPFVHSNEFMIGELVKKGKYPEIPDGMCPPEMRTIINAILTRQTPETRPTINVILRHPFIHKWAADLGLMQFFPPEAQDPVLGPEFIGLEAGGSEGREGGGGREGGLPSEEEIREFMLDTAKAHPEYTVAQFKTEYLEAVGGPWSLGRYNVFHKMQLSFLHSPSSSSSSFSSSSFSSSPGQRAPTVCSSSSSSSSTFAAAAASASNAADVNPTGSTQMQSEEGLTQREEKEKAKEESGIWKKPTEDEDRQKFFVKCPRCTKEGNFRRWKTLFNKKCKNGDKVIKVDDDGRFYGLRCEKCKDYYCYCIMS